MSRIRNAKDSKILKRLKQLAKGQDAYSAFAGVPESARYPDGMHVAEAAFYNEYGTKTIPPRPAMRTTAAENGDKWKKLFEKLVSKGMPTEQALGVIGKAMEGAIVASISEWTEPPNAPATVRQKDGRNTPLRDTKAYFQSISFEVHKVGKAEGRVTVQ